MERSSPKLVIALVLLVVCVVSCFEAATAQYGGSSSNGAAATVPMAAGGSCSQLLPLCSPSQRLSGTETLTGLCCSSGISS
uniref:Uncharacterized protein n=1 Tax=Oryza meridionalis TaxID=40149 RepID=A0A0E0F981_9ORYZ